MAVQNPLPDKQAVLAHLTHLTRRWGEIDAPCLLEIVYLTAEDTAKVKHVAHYNPDPLSLDIAADDALDMNAHRINAYVTVNPVSRENRPPPSKRAKAENILASFFHFADGDDPDAANRIRSFAGPRPTFHVLTGTEPAPRPHVYWELDEPTLNLAAWSETQRAIAATLGTDPAVIDPPRIMRLAGTVNWPKPKKQAKGYKPETVTMRVYDDRDPVTSEQMHRAFAGAPKAAAPGAFQIDVGGHGNALDRALAVANVKAGTDWRDNVKRLVASYVARGWTDDEILDRCAAFTIEGYTVDDTRKDVAAFIEWTRQQEARSGGRYAVSPTHTAGAELPVPNFDHAPQMTPEQKQELPPAPFAPWTVKDLAAIPTPQFVYSDFYARGYTSLTLAPPKVGKSMLGLAEAVDMATGRGILTGVERAPLTVLYYNAEDDQDVIDNRVAALLTAYGIDQSEIAGRLFPVSGVSHEDMFLVYGPDGTIHEPAFARIENWIAENNADVLIFDPLQDMSLSPETNDVFRILGRRLRRMAATHNVAQGIIHHTRKILPGMQPTIDDARGGSSLRGTARFNRVLSPMTEDEAAKAGLDNHRYFFRIGDVESNLAPPSSTVNRWFEKQSIPTPSGARVGAIRPWQWPDAFDGITPQNAAQVRAVIDGMAEPPRADVRSAKWVGEVVADVLGINLADKAERARVKEIVAVWVRKDVLRIVEGKDSRAGRSVQVVVCGGNNPLATSETSL